jgi:hypothetical protein
MPRKKPDHDEPEKYIDSVRDPQYSYEENHYVLAHLFGPGRDPLMGGVYKRWLHGARGDSFFTIEEKEGLARQYVQEIYRGWKRDRIFTGSSGNVLSGWVFRSEQMEWVLGAVRVFGMDAIRLVESNFEIVIRRNEDHLEYPVFSALDNLGWKVSRVIRFWKYRGEAGDLEQRREAIRWLNKIFGELIPKTKGRREKSLVKPGKDVLKHYLKELFRAYQIRKALTSGERNLIQRINSVSQRINISQEGLKFFWRLDDECKPISKPMSPKEMARILTSRHFNFTQSRLILIRYQDETNYVRMGAWQDLVASTRRQWREHGRRWLRRQAWRN